MAFADELLALGGDRVPLVPEDTDGLPDIAAALADTAPGAAVYCCGPDPLLTAVERAVSTHFPDRHLHLERFGSQPGGACGSRMRPATRARVDLCSKGVAWRMLVMYLGYVHHGYVGWGGRYVRYPD